MSDEAKTVLEWTFEPEAYFEVPRKLAYADGEVTIQEGTAKGVFGPSHYGQREFRDAAQEFLKSVFFAQQVQVNKPFELSVASMAREHPSGRRDVTAFLDTIEMKVTVHAADIVVRDKDGNVVSDTKADRIKKQEQFGDSVAKQIHTDPVLKRMLQSFDNALKDCDNSLIHLYEIREAASTAFGGEHKALKELPVSESDWSLLGKRANSEPLLEGRHRGKHSGLRKMTPDELSESLKTAQSIIEGYLSCL